MSTLDQSTESGSTGTPLRVTCRPCAFSTEDASGLDENHPPPLLCSCGPSSCVLIPDGTPHDGWKMTNSMLAEKIGVGVLGLPTTIFSDSTTLPSSTTRVICSG